MDEQLKNADELNNKIDSLKAEIVSQEEQLFMLDAMKAQLKAMLKTNQEELKLLQEKKKNMKFGSYTLSKTELKQKEYELQNEMNRLIAKQDKTDEDFKRMKQIEDEGKEIIKILEKIKEEK
jgi:hypothetical protein